MAIAILGSVLAACGASGSSDKATGNPLRAKPQARVALPNRFVRDANTTPGHYDALGPMVGVGGPKFGVAFARVRLEVGDELPYGGRAWRATPKAWELIDDLASSEQLDFYDAARGSAGFFVIGLVSHDDDSETFHLWKSVDSESWIDLTTPWSSGDFLPAVATRGDVVLVAVHRRIAEGVARGDVWRSTDGGSSFARIADPQVSGEGTLLQQFAVTDNGFVAIGETGGEGAIWTSSDGARWTRAAGAVGSGNIDALAASSNGKTIVGVGTEPAAGGSGDRVTSPRLTVSTDGGVTTRRIDLMSRRGDHVQVRDVIALPDGGFVAGGSIQHETDEPLGGLWVSRDGVTWTEVELPRGANEEADDDVDVVMLVGDTVVAVGSECDDECSLAAWRSA